MIGRRFAAPWIVIVLCAAGVVGSAQQRDRPAASNARAADPHTGRVAGVVTLSPAGNEPVRRAVVSLISVDGGDGASTVTDDEGRFSITGVPDGRYTLVADKPAYLPSYYGAKRPGRQGVSVVVAKGEALDGLRIWLPKGAVITGRLVQATGAPVRNMQVAAILASQASGGGRFDTRARPFYSDDQGIYRIYGLPPGDYIVAALPQVGFGDIERRTAAEYDEVVRALGRGEAPRAGRVARLGYAPMYFPGTPIAAAARAIRVGVGDERDGIDIPLSMFEMSEISGTVTDVTGQPSSAVELTVAATGPALPPLAGPPVRRVTSPDLQGRFRISNMPPGVYTLTARGGGITVDARGTTIRSAEQTDWAMTRLQVTGDDIEGVMLALQPGLTLSGRVNAPGLPASALTGIRVSVVLPGTDAYSARSATIGDGGAFAVTGIHPDTYELVVALPSALSSQWAVRSVVAGGVDIRDQPLTFERGSIGDVAINLTDRRTEVAGTLSTTDGAPTSDYFVVIFPEARALWHPRSPRMRVVRPGANGSFSARDLPAGAYRIAAVTDVADDEWRQAPFLEWLFNSSVPIVVKDGEVTRQDLAVSAGR